MLVKCDNVIGWKCQMQCWILCCLVIIVVLFTVSFLELHTSEGWILRNTSNQNSKRYEEYDLVIMTTVDMATDDIDLLQNWTSLFTSQRSRMIFFTADDTTELTGLFPTVDVITINSGMKMCHRPFLLSLNSMYEIAAQRFKSHFYMLLDRNTLISTEIVQTVGNLIRDHRNMVRKEATLIIARSRDVQNAQEALGVLSAQLHMPLPEVKYSLGGSSDVFITNRAFKWSNMPKMIAHQMTTSEMLIALCRHKGFVLLDITKSSNVIRIINENRRHKASGYVKRYIKKVIMESGIESNILETCGNIMCVGLETKTWNGRTIIVNRDIPIECNECNVQVHLDAPWLP